MRWLRGQLGVTLIEMTVALGILGVLGVAFMTALGTGSKATGTLDEEVLAAALARSQLEDIKNATYMDCAPTPCYTVTVDPPLQYSVSIQATDLDGNPLALDNTIQKLTVSVSQGDKPVLSLTTYKKK